MVTPLAPNGLASGLSGLPGVFGFPGTTLTPAERDQINALTNSRAFENDFLVDDKDDDEQFSSNNGFDPNAASTANNGVNPGQNTLQFVQAASLIAGLAQQSQILDQQRKAAGQVPNTPPGRLNGN